MYFDVFDTFKINYIFEISPSTYIHNYKSVIANTVKCASEHTTK